MCESYEDNKLSMITGGEIEKIPDLADRWAYLVKLSEEGRLAEEVPYVDCGIRDKKPVPQEGVAESAGRISLNG